MSDTSTPRATVAAASLRGDNHRMVRKLLVVTALMFCFGYALVPIYRAICTALGINVLSLSELATTAGITTYDKNSQVDLSRTITIEFDANARGPWEFKPAQRSVDVHPGQLTTVMLRLRSTWVFALSKRGLFAVASRSDSDSTLIPSAVQIAR